MKKKLPLNICLVDDDPAFGQALINYLNHESAYPLLIKTFECGEDLLLDLQLKPDLIILDYYLHHNIKHVMNGLGILKALNNKLPQIPVIMISTEDDIKTAVQMIKLGAYDYIPKSSSAFVKIKNTIENYSRHKIENMKLNYKLQLFKRINLLVLIIVILLFIVTHFW